MKFYKLENNEQLYLNDKISKIISLAMFNPTYGRIKSAAEGIYGKEQGRLYVAEEEEILGIIGVRRVDNKFVEIMHIAVDPDYQGKGIGSKLIDHIREVERVDEIHAETDDDAVGFYKKYGFKITENYDPIIDCVRYQCILKN
jgi:ribosomal protein S18 acetylase RimI-like enzyme